MKVVINKCYGGFGLSDKAIDRLKELAKKHGDKKLIKLIEENKMSKRDREINKQKYWGLHWIDRTHPLLIKVIEELKEEANGTFAELKIVEIPDDVEWGIEEYDGIEWISEKHRVWG